MLFHRTVFMLMLLCTGTGALFAEEVSIQRGSVTLTGNLETAAGRTLSDGVVLMTHAGLGHHKMETIVSIQEHLKNNGFNSLAFTLSLDVDKRQGWFDCNASHAHKHSDSIIEIGLWLDWLKKQGAKNITLFGHSRGGNQTAWFASEHADPSITHVTLLAPDFWYYDKKKTSYGDGFDAKLKQANGLIKAGKGTTMMPHTHIVFCKDTQVRADTFADYYNENPHHYTPDLLPKIKQPVLVIAGSDDELVKHVPEKYSVTLKQKDRLETIAGADHFFRDLYAEDVANLIAGFIK